MGVLELGIAAAALQVAGYLVYGAKILSRDISPNPTSWLMFAYGTTLLLILEWDHGAGFALLALPLACALSSIIVAVSALRKSRRGWWPEHTLERFSFVLDIILTISYVSAWILLLQNFISDEHREFANTFILMCWNIGVFTAFFPLLRQVYYHPAHERATPWIIWTAAYSLLAFITLVEQGGVDELFVYPLLSVAIHGFIAVRLFLWHLRKN